MNGRFSPDMGRFHAKANGDQREASALHDEVCMLIVNYTVTFICINTQIGEK